MVGWHHRLNAHEFGWTPEVGYGQGGLECCSSWGRKESDTTEWLNWTELNDLEDLFMGLLAILGEKKSIKYLLSHWLFVISLSSHEFFNYSGYYTLFSCFLKYFHSFCRLAFHFFDSLLGTEHLFINDFLMSFYLIFLTVLLGSYLINHCLIHGHEGLDLCLLPRVL